MKTSPPRSRRRCTQPPSRTCWPTCARVSSPARWVRRAVALTESGVGAVRTRSTRFGVEEDVVELIRGGGLEQLLAHRVSADQAGDATQDLDVQTGRRLRPYNEKNQPHRLAVDGVERHWTRGDASDHR